MGSHAAVQANPTLWANAGADPEAMAQVAASRLYGQPLPDHRAPRAPEIRSGIVPTPGPRL